MRENAKGGGDAEGCDEFRLKIESERIVFLGYVSLIKVRFQDVSTVYQEICFGMLVVREDGLRTTVVI